MVVDTCTIRVCEDTREMLKALRDYPKEPINSVIVRLIEAVCEFDEDEGQKQLEDFVKVVD